VITHGSLFSGIGGFDLGFQWANIKTLWDVEIEPYCQKVLRKNFPDTEIFSDVKKVRAQQLIPVDVISGGFPCQDISTAGNQLGLDGPRSGLWSELFRFVSRIRPRFAVIENVSNLARLGLDRVLTDLASIGYDAEWQCISARAVGANHIRERIWIVAYPRENRSRLLSNDNRDGKKTDGSSSRHKQTDSRSWPEIPAAEFWASNDGLPAWIPDGWAGVGNAIVPQIAEIIGRRLVELLQYKKAA